MRAFRHLIARLVLAVMLATVFSPSFGWEMLEGMTPHDASATLGDMHHAPQQAEESCHGHAMKGDALASDTHASSPADGDLQHHCCPGHVLGHLQAGLGQGLALPLPRAGRATVDRAETAFSSRAPDGLERPPRHAA